MNVIGLVTLHLILGEKLQNVDYDNFYKFAINKIKINEETEDLVKDKCAITLIEEAVNQFGSTYIFISDDHSHEELLNNLQINFVNSYNTQPTFLSHFNSKSFDNLVIFGNKLNLRGIIKKKKPLQGTKFFIYVRNYQEAVKTFEILWESRLINVVATYIDNRTAYYYTYFPYCSKHCGKVGEPHLLAQCDISNGIFSYRELLFPRKVYDLHKCPVAITFTENIPSSYYTETNELTGWEIELLNEILERINGIPNYTFLKPRRRVYGKSNGYQLLVENSEIGGGLVVSLKSLIKTDFCMYGMSLCATWIVPRKEGIPYSPDFLVKVFPPPVWALTFLTYFGLASIIAASLKLRLGNVLFKFLPYLLGTTTRTKKVAKRLGGLWLLFCLIMNAIYQSGFQSTLLVPNVPKQVTTTKEVLESKLKILGVPDLITDALPYLKGAYNLSNRRFRRNRRMSYEDWVYRLTVKKDSAFLGFKETVHYNTDKTELANKIYIPEHCVVKYLLSFVLKKNSHLTETLIKFSNKMNENGFLVYFIRKHLSRESRQHIPKKLMRVIKPLKDGDSDILPPPISMDKMFVVFMCFAVGISLAIAAFTFELISKCNWRKFRKIILRELQSAWSFNK